MRDHVRFWVHETALVFYVIFKQTQNWQIVYVKEGVTTVFVIKRAFFTHVYSLEKSCGRCSAYEIYELKTKTSFNIIEFYYFSQNLLCE